MHEQTTHTSESHSALRTPHSALPLLPLSVANVPRAMLDVLRQAGVPTVSYSSRQPLSRFVLADRREGPLPAVGEEQQVIDVAQLNVVGCDDWCAALDDERAVTQAWQIGDLTVSERVARIDKRQLTRRVLAAVQQIVEQHGGVWLTVSPVPAQYRTAFNLRADHDSCIPADFQAFCNTIAGHEQAVSHFVCAGGFVEQPQLLDRLRGQDVGSHGFWHHTYRDALANLRNVSQGIECLQQWGFEPSGFVAPHGRFERGMQQTLDRLAISHSGEFAFSYQDWPRYPSGSRVLQLPVHPICLGIAFEALRKSQHDDESARQHAADTIAEHFCSWARAQHAACEPIFIYGHPDERLGRYTQVLRRLFATIDALPGVWSVTQSEFARWWRARQEISFRVWHNSGRLQIDCDRLPRDFSTAVEVYSPQGIARVALADRRQIIELAELNYERRAEPPQLTSTVLDEPPSFDEQIRAWLDWEHVTPVDAIDTSTWRGWLKRSLRQLRDPHRRAA